MQSPEAERLRQEFVSCSAPFKGLETEHKQVEYFVKSGCFIQPLEQNLSSVSYVQQRHTGSGCVRQVAVTDIFQRIPLTPLMSLVVKVTGVLRAILSWQQRKGDALQDFFDGEFCKAYPLFLKEVSIPLLCPKFTSFAQKKCF